MSRPTALVVRAPGTNRDHDVSLALELAGAAPKIVTMAALRSAPKQLGEAQMLVLAGGFSHADALGAGALAALELSRFLGDALRDFLAKDHPILGICNGFQMLVRSGLLPGSLTHNQLHNDGPSGFTCRWVSLTPTAPSRSVWTSAVTEPIECPVAHGEGRYVADDDVISAHTALQYNDGTNPNGSYGDTAGVTDATGLVLGLMPHPENHVLARQHPRWTRGEQKGLGLSLFEGGVRHAKERG
jgi:phosphoribosylformylglycinamidine synthase subunit PurQ / glutaminase